MLQQGVRERRTVWWRASGPPALLLGRETLERLDLSVEGLGTLLQARNEALRLDQRVLGGGELGTRARRVAALAVELASQRLELVLDL
jgi:hypothetical protein